METLELIPGVPLDEEVHSVAAAWCREIADGGEAAPLFPERPTLDSLCVLADILLAGISALDAEESGELVAILGGDFDALSRLVATPEQACAFAAAIFGQHRVDPEGDGNEARIVLAAVGEVLAAPLGAPDGLALLLIGLLARSRWRYRGLVRDPREPTACMPVVSVG